MKSILKVNLKRKLLNFHLSEEGDTTTTKKFGGKTEFEKEGKTYFGQRFSRRIIIIV